MRFIFLSCISLCTVVLFEKLIRLYLCPLSSMNHAGMIHSTCTFSRITNLTQIKSQILFTRQNLILGVKTQETANNGLIYSGIVSLIQWSDFDLRENIMQRKWF